MTTGKTKTNRTRSRRARYVAATEPSPSASVGVITDRQEVLHGVRRALPGAEVRQISTVREASVAYECKAFVLDTAVTDFADWPTVTASAPRLSQLPWVFVVSGVGDINRLSPIPPDSAFTNSSSRLLHDIAARLMSRLDPQARQNIVDVSYGEAARVATVRMGSGRVYVLRLDDIPGIDASPVMKCTVSRNRRYFWITQASGNKVDVQWDTVLYHCEPEYEYYKGHVKHDEAATAVRIGERVRKLRLAGKMTAAELARRAGMQRPNLTRLEGAKHVPSLETVEKVAKALGVTVADLVTA